MSLLYEYLMFLAQVVTIVIAVVLLIIVIVSASAKQGTRDRGYLVVELLNDRLRHLRLSIQEATLPAAQIKKLLKADEKARKAEEKSLAKRPPSSKEAGTGKNVTDAQSQDETLTTSADGSSVANIATDATEATDATDDTDTADDGASTIRENANRNVFVVHFKGDVEASEVKRLRLEISAILTLATPDDEVIICLESPGGMVHSYGLAASQLMRVRNKGIPLTVVVDQVAASGGYLMAAVANKVLAAPFAVIGSIGVVAQVPNVHRLLKKNDVDVEVVTAGKYKRTLTLLGENTEDGRQKFKEELEEVHLLFQEFVVANRPKLDIEAVATGEAWYGKRALQLGLIDELATSDEYLMDLCEEFKVYEVKWQEVQKPIQKLFGQINLLVDRVSHLLEFVRR